jgi:DNA-binding transcriptional regulator YiaG
MTVSELLTKHGLKLTELKRITGVPYSTLQKWKLGSREPDTAAKTLINLLGDDVIFNRVRELGE